MDGLPRLVDRLFGSKQDRNFIVQLYCLAEFRGADGSIDDVMQLITADQPSRELELRFGGAALVEMAFIECAGFLIGDHQLNAYRATAGDKFILGIGDDYAYG